MSGLDIKNLVEKVKTTANKKETLQTLTILSVLYTLLLIFLSRTEIVLIDWSQFFPVFIKVFFLYFLSHFLQNLAYSILLERKINNFIRNSQIYYKTILMKRMPGGFWHWIGRSQHIIKSGGSDQSVGSANFYEFSLLLLSGLALFIGYHNILFGLLFVLSSILVLLFVKNIFRKISNLDLILTIIVWSIYSACWLLGALKLQLLINLLVTPNIIGFPKSLSVWTLATSVSMITSFFPNMGVFRDFTISSLLHDTLKFERILLLNAEMRVLYLSFDLLSALLALSLIKLCWRGRDTE